METKTIARPYAKAAFSFASESGRLPEWSVMLEAMSLISSDSEVREYLRDPSITREYRSEVLIDIADSYLDQSGRNFVSVMTEQGRHDLFSEVHKQFEMLKSLNENSKDVTIYSPFTLSDEEKSYLSQRLTKHFAAEIKLSEQIDKSLIGGVVIKTDDLVIDHSIKGRLHKLAATLDI